MTDVYESELVCSECDGARWFDVKDQPHIENDQCKWCRGWWMRWDDRYQSKLVADLLRETLE